MANLKEIRNRIQSVSSTRQITSAMKMVSAAKLKRAQNNILQLRPYTEKLSSLLHNLSSQVEDSENVYSRTNVPKNILIIPISSNRGLCGAFNSNILKATNHLIQQYKSENKVNITVLSAGKKSYDYFRRTEYNIKGNLLPKNLNDLINNASFENFIPHINNILDGFLDKQYDRVVLVYNKFKNAAVQEVVTEQILPFKKDENFITTDISTNNDYIIEPSKSELYHHLVPKYLKIQFYKAFIDSNASEHGSRMTAMHKATDNASSLIKDLKLHYNKARQAAITGEILEISAGAEALNG